jgi:hypothetical protein
MVSDRAQIVDRLATFGGVPVHRVLQEVAESATDILEVYRIVSDAYVTGIMQEKLSRVREDL